MISNKILTKDDKEKLANFLFQYLNAGVSKERINDLAQTWIKKGGKVNNEEYAATWDEYRDKELGREMTCSLIIGTLPLAILFGLVAGFSKSIGEKAVTVMGIFAGLAAVAFLASVGYLINQYDNDKKYASACAEKAIDAHNVKCYKELKNTSHKLINELLDNQASNNNLYPNLNHIQLEQYSATAPPENAI